jgi:HSP20 family protein
MWSLIPWKKETGGGGALSTVQPLEREFSRIRDEFDSLFRRLWNQFPAFAADDVFDSRWGWDIDVVEADDHYLARIPAPGFEVEDFDVHVSGNHLVVKAEHKDEQKGKNGSSYRYGRVQRMIPLPEGVETDQIECRYHNGMLELKFPKGKEAQTKKITVKAV